MEARVGWIKAPLAGLHMACTGCSSSWCEPHI
jgi:hypothetical protein